jgi:hypothetical protein
VHDVHLGQLVQADDPAGRGRVRAGDPRHRFEVAQAHHLQRGGNGLTLGGQPAQARVGAPLADRGELRVQRRFQPGQVDVGPGGGRPQPRGGLDRQRLGQVRRHHEPQPGPPDPGGLPGPAHAVIDQRQHGPGLLQQHRARLGQPHPVAEAAQQRGAHHLLQPPDLLAQRRLRDVHLLGGMREGARVRDGHEVAQVPQLHPLRRHAARTGQQRSGRGLLDLGDAHVISLPGAEAGCPTPAG